MMTKQCISGLEASLCLNLKATYWPCRAEGIWEDTALHSLAHMLHFRGNLELAPRSLTTELWWCSQSKLQCRRSCLCLSPNFCPTDHKQLPVDSAQSCLQQELTMYSSASDPLLMFLIIPKAITGRQVEPEDIACRWPVRQAKYSSSGGDGWDECEWRSPGNRNPHQCSGSDLTEGLRGMETFKREVPPCSSSKQKQYWERWFTRWRFINRWEIPVQQCQQIDTDLPGKLLPPSKHLAWASPTQTTEGIIALLILVTTSSKRVNKAHNKHEHIPAN